MLIIFLNRCRRASGPQMYVFLKREWFLAAADKGHNNKSKKLLKSTKQNTIRFRMAFLPKTYVFVIKRKNHKKTKKDNQAFRMAFLHF